MADILQARLSHSFRHFADDFCRIHFLEWKILVFWYRFNWNLFSLMHFTISHKPALVQIMAWHLSGAKSLSESMPAYFTYTYASLGLNKWKMAKIVEIHPQWRHGHTKFITYNDVIMTTMASQINSLTIVLLNCSFGHRLKKTSKLRVTGLFAGKSPVTGEFPAQRTNNAENVSIWWRHHLSIWKYHVCW